MPSSVTQAEDASSEGIAAGQIPGQVTPTRRSTQSWYSPWRRRRSDLAALTGACLVLVALLVVANHQGVRSLFQPDRPRLSLVVLPFDNLGRDPDDAYLVAGVTDDLTAALSHIPGTFVISRATAYSIFNGPLADIAAKAGPLPLAVSVDEEGGRVSRLKSLIGPAPSARQLAQTQTVAQVHDLAADRGKKMRELGITIDFAPVVDVTDAPDDSVIGDRSFGSNPETVTEYAGAYAQGLRDAGLLPVLKHFPGHGHGSGDSHTRWGGHATAERLADRRPGAVPNAGDRGPGRGDGGSPAGSGAYRR